MTCLREVRRLRKYFDQIAEGKVKKAKVNYLPCPPLMEYLYPFISFIQGTNVKHFGYDIFFYLGTDQFNYNVYDGKTKDEYDWHTDGTGDRAPTDIKIDLSS